MKKSLFKLLFIALAASAFAPDVSAADSGVYAAPSQKNLRIHGLMTYDTLKNVENYGIYDYTVTTPISRKLSVSIPRISASGGSVVKGDTLYYYDYSIDYGYVSSANYYKYNLKTGTSTRKSVGYDTEKAYANAAMSVATDPTDGTVYCCSFSYDTSAKTVGYALATWNLEGMTKTVIGTLETPLRVLAATADGKLYGITASTAASGSENNGGILVSVDKQTGKLTTIGDTGVRPGAYFQSATIDTATGTFYWFANEQDEASNLYTIDLSTGAATKIGALPVGDQVVCSYITSEYGDDVPSPAENLTATFAAGALTGKISFLVPAETYSGAKLSGTVNYTIALADGKTLAEGTANAGEEKSVDVTLSADGQYTFLVTLSNASGKSPATDTALYVGYDTPEAVTDVTLTREGTTNTVTWTAPKAGLNGGYIDAEAMTYVVTRQPGDTVVSSAGTATSFSETFDTEELGSYYYEVVAVNGTHKSAVAKSNSLKIGSALVPPYSEDFSSSSALDLFTIINANGDSNTWTYSSGTVRYRTSYTKDADDWLITPPLKLKAGNSYTLTFNAWALSSRSEERMEVKMGKAATVDGMTTTVKDVTTYTETSRTPASESVEIVPTEDGIYYIGFHAVSLKSKGNLSLDNIAVSAPVSNAVPAVPDSFSVTPADNGKLAATISFKAPKLTAEGKTLESISKYEILRGETVISTVTAVNPGDSVSFVDETVPANGTYTYSVLFYNAEGAGKAASAEVYVGLDIPMAPTSAHVTDNFDGTATLSWSAVSETGKNGGYVDSANTLFDITDNSGKSIATDVKGTQTEISGIDIEGTQALLFFKVSAHNAVGKASTTAVSDTILSGKPYALPFEEKFNDAAYNNTLWSTVTLAGKSYNGRWSPRNDDDFESDGGYGDFQGYTVGTITRLQSPKISVSGANPLTLSFISCMPGSGAKVSLQVSADYGEWQTVAEIDSTEAWTQHQYDLTQWNTAKTLRIGFLAECTKSTHFAYIDNITLSNVSGVETLTKSDNGSIIINGNQITVSNPDNADIYICNIAGQVMAAGKGFVQETLNSGMYIVRNGSTVRKVMIQ